MKRRIFALNPFWFLFDSLFSSFWRWKTVKRIDHRSEYVFLSSFAFVWIFFVVRTYFVSFCLHVLCDVCVCVCMCNVHSVNYHVSFLFSPKNFRRKKLNDNDAFERHSSLKCFIHSCMWIWWWHSNNTIKASSVNTHFPPFG